MKDAIVIGSLLLLIPVIVLVAATMRAGMFWCKKCKTYHYKSCAPRRCFNDFCDREQRREGRRLDAIHRK